MASQILNGSAIETAHVHYGPFCCSRLLKTLKLDHHSPFIDHVSFYCLCCLHPQIAEIFQSSRQQHCA